jgi:HrpA-like RNA helicase
MQAYPTAEIHRTPLEALVLDVLALGMQPSALELPDPPPAEALAGAITSLRAHGALADATVDPVAAAAAAAAASVGAAAAAVPVTLPAAGALALTPLGRMLARLPVDVPLGKTLVLGAALGAADAVLPVAAGLAVPSPFAKQLAGTGTDGATGRREFQASSGDALTVLNVFSAWLVVKSSGDGTRRWARQRGVVEQRLYEMIKLRDQFGGMRSVGLSRVLANVLSPE